MSIESLQKEQSGMRLGIDLGGTKVEIIALADDGNVLLRERAASPATDFNATVKAIVGLIQATETRLKATGSVGIGIPVGDRVRLVGPLPPVDRQHGDRLVRQQDQ